MRIKINSIKTQFFFIVVLLISLTIYSNSSIYNSANVLISNFIIIVLSLLFMVYGDNYPYSLNKIFMMFSFFFFGIAPILQYQKGITLWNGVPFSSEDYFRMNIIIILILNIYQFMYLIFKKTKFNDKYYQLNTRLSNEFSIYKLFLLSLLSLIATMYFNNFNLQNLFFRAGGEVERVSINQSVYLIYAYFIRPIPAITLLLFKLKNIRHKKMELILWSLLLISNFPASRARFYIGAIYIPLFIIYFKSISKDYLKLNKIIIVGLLFIFPILDQARRISTFENFEFKIDFNMFLQGHFDSYQMFMRVVTNNYVTNGKQLLGSLFFYIPRNIWPNKPVGSGYTVSSIFGLSYDNISMNFFGEGFINFGYIGILLFIAIIAFLNANLDKNFWKNFEEMNIISPYYLFLLGLEFFILRGDLLSSVSFTLGLLSSVYFVKRIAIKNIGS